MKNLHLCTAIAALLAAPAFAGGYVAPVASAPPTKAAQAAAYDWSGAYAGLSYGTQRQRQTRAVYGEQDIIETRREERPFTKRDLQGFLRDNGGCTPGQKFNLVSGDDRAQVSCQSVLNAEPNESWDNWAVEGFDPVVTEWEEVVGSEEVPVGTETYRTSESTAGVFLGVRHQFANRLVGGVEAQYTRIGDGDSIRAMGQLGVGMGRFLPYATAGYDFETDDVIYGAGLDVAISPRVLGGLLYTQDSHGEAKRLEARLGWRF